MNEKLKWTTFILYLKENLEFVPLWEIVGAQILGYHVIFVREMWVVFLVVLTY